MFRTAAGATLAIVAAAWLASGGPAGVAAQGAAPETRAALIRGGEIVDGTGAPRVAADVRIVGETIAQVGPNLPAGPNDFVVNAAGKVVAPGFIDMHSHASGGLEKDPAAESQLHQGITTAVVGVDGGMPLPVADFFDEVARLHPSINFVAMVGHASVRKAVMGGDYRRTATPPEVMMVRPLRETVVVDFEEHEIVYWHGDLF